MEKIFGIIEGLIPYIAIIYMAMLLSIVIDLFVRLIKAKDDNTISFYDCFIDAFLNVKQDVLPLVGFTLLDCMMAAMSIYDLPYITFAYGIFCTLKEAKSIFINTHTEEEKNEIVKDVKDVISHLDNKEEMIKDLTDKVLK